LRPLRFIFGAMKDLKLWQFILKQLEQKQPVIFMCVLESVGSSPGRQGFKMAVTENDMCGSVGGGIMEHKFVELAKDMLKNGVDETLVKRQIHSKSAASNQSGMICSGEQTLAVYLVKTADAPVIQKIIASLETNQSLVSLFSPLGFSISPDGKQTEQFAFKKQSDTEFLFTERTGYSHRIHIIGGGHCALAFSELMSKLHFYISVYDDRHDLNTMEQNTFAHQKQVVDYEHIGELIPESENEFVVIMTFGYRTDGIVLRQLIHKKFRYMGMLGSRNKIEKMLQELRSEGVEESKIEALHAPVGIPIHSQTPEEIAISIAAEIIKVKNERQ